VSFADTVVLFILALLLFGPKKLPGIARQVGKALNEFKRASNEFKSQIEAEISQLELQELKDLKPKELMSEVLKPLELDRNNDKPEQKNLPPAVPPAGAVESSRFSGQAETSVTPVTPEASPPYIDSTAPHA